MLAKKGSVTTTSPARLNRKELEYLYARRSAIDSLIQSLVEYDRFRTRRLELTKRKTA
jgi:hypothetical protein